MLEPDHFGVHGQHDSGFVHQQGRGYEISALLWRLSLPTSCPNTSGDSDRMVSPSGDFRPSLPEVVQADSRLICNQIQSQTSQVCVSSSGQVSLEGRCVESPVGGSRCVCLPSDSSSGAGGLQTFGPRLSPTHSDCSKVAKHAMVLGPGQHAGSNSSLSSQDGEFVDPTFQSVPTQGPLQPEPPCMAPTAAAIQQAGFSDEVAARIEAPQRCST